MNNGIGPAVIKSFELSVDGKEIEGKRTEKIEKALKILFPKQKYSWTASYLDGGYVMAPKEKRPLVSIKFLLGSMPATNDFNAKLNRTSIRILLESVYRESFVYKTNGL